MSRKERALELFNQGMKKAEVIKILRNEGLVVGDKTPRWVYEITNEKRTAERKKSELFIPQVQKLQPYSNLTYNNGDIELNDEVSKLDKIIDKLQSKGYNIKVDFGGLKNNFISRALTPYIGGDINNVLIVGDIHEPVSIDGYLEFCRKQQEKFNCGTVVYIGDIVDFNSISYHEKLPEELNPRGELSQARLRLQDWYKTFPIAKVCLGNHDLLPYRQARTAGIMRELIIEPNKLFEAPDTYSFVDEIILDNVLYTHGTQGNAFVKCVKEGMNMVQGHLHTTAGVMYHRNRLSQIRGMQVGTGIDYKTNNFNYAKTNSKHPVLSCGVVLNNGTLPILIPFL